MCYGFFILTSAFQIEILEENGVVDYCIQSAMNLVPLTVDKWSVMLQMQGNLPCRTASIPRIWGIRRPGTCWDTSSSRCQSQPYRWSESRAASPYKSHHLNQHPACHGALKVKTFLKPILHTYLVDIAISVNQSHFNIQDSRTEFLSYWQEIISLFRRVHFVII